MPEKSWQAHDQTGSRSHDRTTHLETGVGTDVEVDVEVDGGRVDSGRLRGAVRYRARAFHNRSGTIGQVSLDPEQQACADLPLSPLAIVAGPGAGKTRTVVARIAALVARGEVRADKILALTHTTKAAGELKDRLAKTGVYDTHVSTVHAMAWRQLRRFTPDLGGTIPQLQASTFGLVKDSAAGIVDNLDTPVVIELCGEIDWAAARMLTPDTYPQGADRAGRDISVDANIVCHVWKRYIERKTRTGIVDFADVLTLAREQLTHPHVRTAIDNAFEAFFVDEYQDIDPLQQSLIDAWLGGRDTLCVVGDPDQAIFSFKGGDPSLLLTFSDRRPNARSVSLTRNYRSTSDIVSWVNAVALHKKVALTAERGYSGTAPRIEICDNETDEERQLVDQLRAWKTSGLRWGDMAILFRYNAISARLEAALSNARIPYSVAGGTNFFERTDVRAVLTVFGARARIEPDEDGLTLIDDAARDQGWDPNHIPDGMGAARQRHDAISALIELVYNRYNSYSAGALLAALLERAKEAHDVPVDSVTLATIHAAKGLEWPAVWVVSCVEGVMPSSYATTRPQLDEERHLFYVAISRAETHLVVSAAKKRHNNYTGKPSSFLDLVGAAQARTAKRRGTTTAPNPGQRKPPPVIEEARCRCGQRLVGPAARTSRACSGPCLTGADKTRYDQLAAWRNDKAATTHSTAGSVATDKALFSIAVRRTVDGVVGLNVAGNTIPPHLYR